MRIAVTGLGLIGGSAALALAEAGHDVTGHDPDPAAREAAAAHFPVTADPAALHAADLAVVAAPFRHLDAAARGLRGYTGLVTDVVSVKAAAARAFADHPRFVGGHPMTGKETAGFAAAEPGLFRGRKWVLCLEADTGLDDWAALARLWTSIGAHVVPATAAEHDRAAARISHLEHLVAAALVLVADDPLARALAAGSFRDGTRVAASPTALLTGMVEGNRAELASALGDLAGALGEAGPHLAEDAGTDAIGEWFDRARALRAAWPPEPGESRRVPLTREALLALGRAGGWIERVETEVAIGRLPRVKSTP
ncbi:prephenate dehydrogenase/arogenate dehydrogenase family protein [Glycomyces sp. A-F 0318]|uniref:prephenate dehydrogenase n=1 Tax=Glycomyces amatae TaxID=2881355 RepID=UPI001E29221F|nr:prephenate dehydrogenase/arogenate dehydrogenase family protein [Glycomyces amatae]MCD0442377.1 prephenate dehydrogenase/arogenate dehydrogenase family protein [Glycomyces amatae]